jgi:nitrogen regulatory protein P-II 1
LKKIEAIIKPLELGEVKDALNEMGIQGITFSDVMGFGRQKGHTDFSKVKMEIIVADTLVPRVLETIRNCAKFVGRIGYHNIFVTDVMEVAL